MFEKLRHFLAGLRNPNEYADKKAFLDSLRRVNRSVNALSELADRGRLPHFKVKT